MLLDFDQLVSTFNLKVKGVIHIGAHYGEEHMFYKKHNINNIVYFEPLSKNFQELKKNITDNSTLFNFALGAETKKVEMFVESNNKGQSSSILEPELHLYQYPHITFDSKEIVDMKRLDDVEIQHENFNLINIDVQGYELEVFKGSISTLSNIDYIISEVNRAQVYKNCVQIDQLDKFLENFGFKRKVVSWEGVTWGDAFYMKDSK